MAEILDKRGEESVIGLCEFAGRSAGFDEAFGEIQEGSEVVIWTEKSERSDPDAYRLRLTAVRAGERALEGAVGSPANKMFEAEVVRTTADRKFLESLEGEDRVVFGVLFPNGFASIVDNAV